AEPGREDGNTTKGYCQSGKHVIRVAENGTIGILWINPDAGNGDHNMYFVESNDGGATWPQNFDPLIPAVVDLDNNRAIAPNNGLDFYYINNKPQFVWETDEQNYNETDSNGYYFPYTGQIFFWSPNSGGNIKCLYYNDARGYIIDSIVVAGGPARVSADYLYQSTNFDVASIPTTQTIELPRYGWTSHTTLAPTSNPNIFAVFYQALSNNDFATEQDRDGADVTEWFGNIYYQVTTDGGSTWSEPRAYRDNSEGTNQLDYHYPSISASNAASASGAQIQIMFQVDSLPGLFENGSGAGYSFNSWFYQNFSMSSVHNTGTVAGVASVDQNFPNPFNSSTTIPVQMKNDDIVTLSLTDMLGREVATIYHGRLSAGSHRIPFTAANLGAGIYTYTLSTSTGSISHTMSLVK
ncbi:MAG: T9SS type A sorting domain-containing protein, partial [Bacteroidota bacterium]|nr:T9SS type A sorting domain-containing protein [Bacteroidota bacterium]